MFQTENKTLKEFWKNHGTRAELISLYTLNAFTWVGGSDKVVLVQNRINPSKNFQLVDYTDYMNNEDSGAQIKVETGTCFNMMRQTTKGESIFESVYQRYFGPEYTSVVMVSNDQKYIAIKRKPDFLQRNTTKLDIFRGFDQEDFFGSKGQSAGHFQRGNNKEYVATIKTSIRVTKIAFSSDKNSCAAYSKDGFQLFDISKDSSINSDGASQERNAIFTMNVSENATYDKIMDVYIGDISNIFGTSYVALQSKMFSLAHLVKIQACKDFQDQTNQLSIVEEESISHSQPIFFEDPQEIKILINSINQDTNEFWEGTFGLFSKDGSKLVVHSASDTYVAQITSSQPVPTKRVSIIESLSNKDVRVHLFGENEFIFAEVSTQQEEIQFWHSDPKTESKILDASIDIGNFDLKALKMLEFTQLQDGTCRGIAVRGGDQVFIWEKTPLIDVIQHFEFMFPSNLSALSMPFYAYSLGSNQIIILPLFDQGKQLVHNLVIQKQEEIQKLVFSRNCDLFVITRRPNKNKNDQRLTDFFAYKICVHEDISYRVSTKNTSLLLGQQLKEKIQGMGDLLSKDKTLKRQNSASQRNEPKIKKFGPFPLRPTIMREKETDIEQVFVCDQERAQESKLTFVCLAELHVYHVSFKYDSEAIEPEINNAVITEVQPAKPKQWKVDSLRAIDEMRYVFMRQNSNIVEGLFIDDSKKGFKIFTVYQETSYKILRCLADVSSVYLLVQDVKKYYLKVFSSKGSSLSIKAFITLDIEDVMTDKFVSSFLSAQKIIDQILFHDSDSISRIHSAGEFSGVQHFSNYFPEKQVNGNTVTDRLTSEGLIVESRHDRFIGLISNFPKSEFPKTIGIVPYFTDNVITLSGSSKSQITWLSHTQQSSGIDQIKGQQSVQTFSHVFQLDTSKWTLSQFNLSGICIKKQSFKDLRSQMLLSITNNAQKFLLTSRDSDFLKKLQIYWIKNDFTVETKPEWIIDTTQLYCEQPAGKEKLQLYKELIKYQKQKFNFKFQVNECNDIAIACLKQAKSLERVFLLSSENIQNKSFQDVVIQPPQAEVQAAVAENAGTALSLNFKKLMQPLLNQDEEAIVGNNETLANTKGFELSDRKLVLWTDNNIYHSEIHSNQFKPVLLLEKSKFVLNQVDPNDQDQSQSGTQIIEVQIRDRKESANPESICIIQIKVMVSKISTVLINYDLTNDYQESKLSSDAEAEFFFDTYGECYVYDQQGITKLQTGETFNEYHRTKLPENQLLKVTPGVSWGERMVPASCGMLLLFNSELILPYSYLSYVQDNALIEESVDVEQLRFYPDEYYKINGRNTLFKYRYEPQLLGRILECYWQINKNFVLSVLVKEQIFSVIDVATFNQEAEKNFSQQNELRQSLLVSRGRTNPLLTQAKMETKVLPKDAFQKGEMKMKVDEGKSIIEDLLAMSHDKFVNEILFMLSRLPIQNSFKLLMPYFGDLVAYSRFSDHLSQWFEETVQSQQVRVIYTGLPQGVVEHRSDYSLLDANFFNTFATKPPSIIQPPKDSEELAPRTCCQSFGQMMLSWLPSWSGEEKPEAQLLPVRITMIETQWMFDPENKKFFDALMNEGDIALFSNPNLQHLISLQWKIFWPCYLRRIFLPFLMGSYIPFLVIVLLTNQEDNSQGGFPIIGFSRVISAAALSLYLLWAFFIEYREMQKGMKAYFSHPQQIFDGCAIAIILYCLVKMATVYLGPTDSRVEAMPALRVMIVWGILIQNLIMLNFLKVFDFWATFVRSLKQIMISSLPLGATLALFVWSQSLMFYVLQGNNTADTENGTNFSYFESLIMSYRFALGDFAITDSFSGAPNQIVFWLIFFIGSVIQLLIILNMVVAVMSATFDEVTLTNEANIYKSKLSAIIDYKFFTTGRFENEFQQFKYLFLLDVDPAFTQLDPIYQNDLPEQLLNNKVIALETIVKSMFAEINNLKATNKSQTMEIIRKIDEQSAKLDKDQK